MRKVSICSGFASDMDGLNVPPQEKNYTNVTMTKAVYEKM